MTPEQLAKRAREIVKDHDAEIRKLDAVEYRPGVWDVSDDDLPRYDELNDSYAYDALELLREYVRQNDG